MNIDSIGYIQRVRDTQQQFFDLHAVVDPNTIYIPKDWLENDENNPKYIQNRTHYVLPDRFELLKTNWFVVDDQGNVTEYPENAPTFFPLRINAETYATAKGYKVSDIYATEDEELAGAGELKNQFITLMEKGCIYNNGKIWKIKDYFDLIKTDPNWVYLFRYLSLNETGDFNKHAYQLILNIDRNLDGSALPALKYIHVLAVKDAGEYRLDLATTPYWGIRETAGVREWYKITDYAVLASLTYGELPAEPSSPPGPEYELNKYYLESATITHTFEEGIYCFCEFDNEDPTTINYSQDFVVNSKEQVVQIPKKYVKDIWDAIETLSGSLDGDITGLISRISTIETVNIPTINASITNLNTNKMNKTDPQGIGTMILSATTQQDADGYAVFENGAYEGTAVANNKFVTAITVNTALDNKLNVVNPAATGTLTLNTDSIVLNGISGVISATDCNVIINSNSVSVATALTQKRNITNFEFDNGNIAAHFSGDLYVSGLASSATKQKVATVNQVNESTFLGIYYDNINFQYPTAQEGNYIFLIQDQTVDAQHPNNNKVVKMVYENNSWFNRGTYDRVFTNDQWTNINTSYNSRVTTLENQVSSLTSQINELTDLINQLVPDAEGVAFGGDGI